MAADGPYAFREWVLGVYVLTGPEMHIRLDYCAPQVVARLNEQHAEIARLREALWAVDCLIASWEELLRGG